MNEPTLTDELTRGILAAIRAGAFPQVAAAAHGIGAALWERWLRRGRRCSGPEPFRRFGRQVEEAQAHARLRAEMDLLEKDARTWLKHGPGRDLPGKPGWAALVRAAPPLGVRGTNLESSPEFLRFLASLRLVLAPFPDALTALAEALDDGYSEKNDERH
jgi:hypothetical protein